jgi:hypothetical protein
MFNPNSKQNKISRQRVRNGNVEKCGPVVHWQTTLAVLGVSIPELEKLLYRKTNTAHISSRKHIYDSDYISLIYIVYGNKFW